MYFLGGGLAIKTVFQRCRALITHMAVFALLGLDCIFGCPIYNILGVTCPGCGLTRAWLCFLTGDVRHALRYHLLFLPAPAFIFLFAHRGQLPKSRLLDFSLYAFAALLAAHQIWRMMMPGSTHYI